MTEAQIIGLCHECKIPEHMHSGVVNYLVHHIEPGDFLLAVLCNDLVGAAGRADNVNQKHLVEWATLLYQIPRNTWGDEKTVQDWLSKRALHIVSSEGA